MSRAWGAATLQYLLWMNQDLMKKHFLGGHSTAQQPQERMSIYRNPCQCEFEEMSLNGSAWISYEWAGYTRERSRPQSHSQFCKRDRDGPQIVSLQVFASQTGATMKWRWLFWHKHSWSTGLQSLNISVLLVYCWWMKLSIAKEGYERVWKLYIQDTSQSFIYAAAK